MKSPRTLWMTLACVLFVGSALSVTFAARDIGVARDETVYMHHGSRYAEWWSAWASGQDGTTSAEVITSHFGGPRATDGNREHPPLLKTLFGLSHKWFSSSLGEIGAYRLPTALFFATLLVLVFAFATRVWGLGAGVAAALFVWFTPRLFFHSGLATFDAPVVTTWFATVYCYYRGLQSRPFAIATGLCLGLALATKHNAVMLPAVLVPHYIYICWRSTAAGLGFVPRLRATLGALVRKSPWMLPACVVIAPLVLVLLWPWLWFDTAKHVGEWLRFHVHHVHYNFEYLGANWNAPPYPWHVPIVTTLVTTPLVTLCCAALGAGRLLRVRAATKTAREHSPGLLLFLSAGVAMGPFLLTTTPIFGAEKHFAPVVPTIAIYAAIGLAFVLRCGVRAAQRVGFSLTPTRRVAVILVAGALVYLGPLVATRAAVPYGLSHYSSLAGGTAGGADLGMNRQFWGYAVQGVFDYLRRAAPAAREVPIYTHDASPAWAGYLRSGQVDHRFEDAGHELAGIEDSNIAFVVHEKHFNRHDYLIWTEYKTASPSFVLTTGGVPIVSVYLRTGSSEGALARPGRSRPSTTRPRPR